MSRNANDQSFFGGKLTTELENTIGVNHAGFEHSVNIVDNLFCPVQTIKVNSFHRHGVLLQGLGSCLLPIAVTLDGLLVEGFRHPEYHIAAVQWHPERKCYSEVSDLIVRQLFL
ncbi:MAG: gamma-glutamyl-gamma-aminobutyrate hydrolase family protein [Chloroflexota bacterium]